MDSSLLIIVIALCLWAITDRHVPTGILITSGLTLIVCACFAALDGSNYISRAFKMMVVGIGLGGWGFFWNLVGRQRWRELSMRWPVMHSLARVTGIERRARRRNGE
jgi:hypothetical protein